jgi:rod shape-determining protein MreD
VQPFKIALTIVVALLLQMVVPTYLGTFHIVDLPLLVTVYFALQRAPLQGMFTGMACGLGEDAIGGGILGVGGFTKTLIGYLVGIVSIRFSLENPLARLGTVAVASAANTALFVGLNLMLEREMAYAETWPQFGKTVGWLTLANTIASIVVFFIIDRVFAEQTAARRMSIKRRFYE